MPRVQIVVARAVLVVALAAGAVEGQSPLLSEQVEGRENGLRLVVTAELDDISPLEVARGGPIPGAVRDLPNVIGSVEGALVSRDIEKLWELWVPEETRPSDLHVSLEVVSAARCDCLANRSDSRSLLGVTIRPTVPVVVDRRQGQVLMQGGAVVELDLASVFQAGTHRAALAVSVNTL